MKKGIILLMCVAALVLFWPGKARAADDNEQAVKAFQEMSDALQKEPGLSQETKDKIRNFGDAMLKMKTSPATASQGAAGKIDEWFKDENRAKAVDAFFGTDKEKGFLERFTPEGNIRMRYDFTNQHHPNPDKLKEDQHARTDQRDQFSTRLRLGFIYEVNPDMWAGVRMATGSMSDANSGEAPWSSDFSKFTFSLDRAYIKYSPFNTTPLKMGDYGTGKLDLFVGKFDHYANFYSGPEFWDPDVQPTGAAGTFRYMPACKFVDTVKLSFAKYVVTEEEFNNDASANVGEIGVEKLVDLKDNGTIKFTAAGSWYAWHDTRNLDNNSSIISQGPGETFENGRPGIGNSMPFFSDFQILHAYLNATYTGINLCGKVRPLSLTYEHMNNTTAESGTPDGHGELGRGYNILLYLGELKKKGDWQIGYGYFNFQRDSLFTLVSGNDFPWQTNYTGHWIDTNYKLFDNTTFHLQFFFGEKKFEDNLSSANGEQGFRLRTELLINF
jgi:hypothetical protein